MELIPTNILKHLSWCFSILSPVVGKVRLLTSHGVSFNGLTSSSTSSSLQAMLTACHAASSMSSPRTWIGPALSMTTSYICLMLNWFGRRAQRGCTRELVWVTVGHTHYLGTNPMMQHTKAMPTIPIRITLLLAIATRKPAIPMHMMNDSARSLIVFPIIT